MDIAVRREELFRQMDNLNPVPTLVTFNGTGSRSATLLARTENRRGPLCVAPPRPRAAPNTKASTVGAGHLSRVSHPSSGLRVLKR